jgi:hypothetical protein
VRKKPGSTVIVLMPYGVISGRGDSAHPSSANLDAAYAPVNSVLLTSTSMRPNRSTAATAASTAAAGSVMSSETVSRFSCARSLWSLTGQADTPGSGATTGTSAP